MGLGHPMLTPGHLVKPPKNHNIVTKICKTTRGNCFLKFKVQSVESRYRLTG